MAYTGWFDQLLLIVPQWVTAKQGLSNRRVSSVAKRAAPKTTRRKAPSSKVRAGSRGASKVQKPPKPSPRGNVGKSKTGSASTSQSAVRNRKPTVKPAAAAPSVERRSSNRKALSAESTAGGNRRAAAQESDKKAKSPVAATASDSTPTSLKAASSGSDGRASRPREAFRPPASAEDPIQFPEERQRLPKTYLSAKELREFRDVLLAKRAELATDLQNLSTELADRKNHGGGDHSSMPIHMADLGSDNWEHEFTLGLLANEQDRIREIDEALERIESGSYGMCLATHRRISKARLRAKPWAKYCIEYARAREEGRAR